MARPESEIERRVKRLMFGKEDGLGGISAETPPITLPRLLLHLEGITILIVTGIFFHRLGFDWSTLVLFILTPDLSFIAFAAGPRVGSSIYNLAHTYAFPLLLALYAHTTANGLLLQIALIWIAHIGMDRALGYGLKFPRAFTDTHLQRL